MARLLSETSYQRVMQTVRSVEDMTGDSRAPSRRRIRSIGGGGTDIVQARLTGDSVGDTAPCDIYANSKATKADVTGATLHLPVTPAIPLDSGERYSAIPAEIQGATTPQYDILDTLFKAQ